MTKRSSSVHKLINDLNVRDKEGTILFIAATLLQREFVETIIPIQVFGVLTALYYADVKSNSITSSWKGPEDYQNAMMYTLYDLAIEMFVFICSVVILRFMFPELNSWRILRGLIQTNFSPMVLIMAACWMWMFANQCFYFGMDPTFGFEWVKCANDENATWNGGFDWEC
jgi:hypothetical protein